MSGAAAGLLSYGTALARLRCPTLIVQNVLPNSVADSVAKSNWADHEGGGASPPCRDLKLDRLVGEGSFGGWAVKLLFLYGTAFGGFSEAIATLHMASIP